MTTPRIGLLKVRWWIPPALLLLLFGVFVARDYWSFKRYYDHEKSTGLGAVAQGSLLPWKEPPAPPAAVAPKQAFQRFSMPAAAPSIGGVSGGVPGASPGGVIGGVIGGVPASSIAVDPPPETPIAHSQFLEAAIEPLSTFSIDVDTASYTNLRRTLSLNALPRADEVRIEEMINYFSYAYPDPRGLEPFSITTEVATCPWEPSTKLLRIGLKSRGVDPSSLPPSRLTFLIDVSGSMSSHDKLPLVKRSLALLVEQLRAEDSVAIVVYAGAEGLVLPPTPGSQRDLILRTIEDLGAGGSTAGGAGLRLAYKTARNMFLGGANNRVILATDGDFNVGLSSDEEMIQLVEDERRHGVFITVLGFGMHAFKDSKLEKIADHGNGHYAYVDSILEAKRVFVEQLGATLQTVAKDVKLQLAFNPAEVRSYRLVGYENRLLKAEDFENDRKDAGDMGAGHTVTALYELIPAVAGSALSGNAFSIKARYKEPQAEQSVAFSVAAKPENPNESASEDFRFAAAVAQFGMILRGSPFKGKATFASTRSLANEGLKGDARRADLIALINRAEALTPPEVSLNSPPPPARQ